jgi:hypothetical protein
MTYPLFCYVSSDMQDSSSLASSPAWEAAELPDRPIKLTLGPTLEFRSHGILAKAVGILVLAGTGETPSQHCKSLKSPCFSTAERNASQQRCSNWRDGNELTR